MRNVILLIILLPSIASAQNIGEIYWSYGCDGYIYHFEPEKGEYHIYTKMIVTDKKHGKYNSYQLTGGTLTKVGDEIYSIQSKDITGKATVDFTDSRMAVFTTEQYGQARLWQCDSEKAKALIGEANEHFKVCQKNTLNCKSL